MSTLPDDDELKAAFKVLKGVEVPKLPEIVLSLQKQLRAENPDLSLIGETLASDIALSGRVLKIVNSAEFGLRSEITSIEQAVTYLGIQRIKDLVMTAALRENLGIYNKFDAAIWKKSQGCAMGAQAIAQNIDGLSTEKAYLAGLFNDAGTLILDRVYADYSVFFLKNFFNPLSFCQLEQQKFKTNHNVISFLLAEHWKLPESVCLAIYNSHIAKCTEVKDPEVRALIAVIKIADNIASHTLLPTLPYTNEASQSLAHAYLEISTDDSSLLDLKESVDAAIFS